LLGFLVYTLGYVISAPGKFNFIICQLFQIIGFVILLFGCIPLIKSKIDNSYLKIIYPIYFIWLLSVIFRGFQFDYISIKNSFINPNGVLLYFTPLIILLPQKLTFYKRIFDVIIIMGISFLVCDVIFIKGLLDRYNELTRDYIETFTILSVPCGFILLTYPYHTNKRKLIAGGIVVLSLLLAIYRARRGLSFICFSILMFSYYIYLINTKKKVLLIYLSILTVVIGVLYISDTYKVNKNGLFGFIVQRGETDTRTGVELYFYNDMKTKDWIIGRGINGEYFCPGIDFNQQTDYRALIETGYLQIILKGGIVSLALYLLISIPAIFLGFFHSKNILSKASAIWIFIAVMSLYPTTVDSFSLQYLVVWISIGICYSKKMRNLPDNIIKEIINNPSSLV